MHSTDSYEMTADEFDDLDNGVQDVKDDTNEINILKKQVEALNNKIKQLEEPKTIDPQQMIINEMLKQQQEMIDYLKAHVKPKKKTKKDPKQFELFLNDLDDLCN